MAGTAPYNRSWRIAPIAPFKLATLVFNPFAGKIFRNPDLPQKAAALLAPLAGRIVMVPTEGPETAGPLARRAVEAGSDLILIAGGDGTVNEVIQGVAGTEACLGILPAGTANVLAVETKIGTNLLRAAAEMRTYRDGRVALGRIHRGGYEPRYFAAMAGVGLDAQIVRRVSSSFKRRFGKLSYWIAGFGALGETLREFDIRLDGQTRRASFALVSRVRNYGGDLHIARHASLLRDDFAVVLFEGASTFRYLKYFSGVLLNRLDGMSGVTVTHAREVEILPISEESNDLQIDGEYAGLAPARLEIAPGALRMLLPQRFQG